MRQRAAALLLLALSTACGETAQVAAPTATATAAPPRAATRPVAAAQAEAADDTLGDELFVESPQSRDPFKSFIEDVVAPVTIDDQSEVLMEDFSLDELVLIATISGGTAPRAMFRDPHSTGVIVQRGDYVSSAKAKVTRILSSKVIVELKEEKGNVQGQNVVAREIYLHPEAPLE
ncbi:MAG: hypothetical protein AABZ30_01930 [Myxococcota bacterium]